MNNNFKILSLLLIITSIFLFVSIFMQRKSSPKIIVEKRSENLLEEPANIFYNTYTSLVIPAEGTIVSDTIKLQDTLFSLKSIKYIVGDSEKLIFRYSYRDCSMCIDSVLVRLSKKFANNSSKLVIITDNDSERDFMVNARMRKGAFQIYNLIDGFNGMGIKPIENNNLPFLFVLDKNLVVKKIFLPFKEDLKKLDEYLNHII